MTYKKAAQLSREEYASRNLAASNALTILNELSEYVEEFHRLGYIEDRSEYGVEDFQSSYPELVQGEAEILHRLVALVMAT